MKKADNGSGGKPNQKPKTGLDILRAVGGGRDVSTLSEELKRTYYNLPQRAEYVESVGRLIAERYSLAAKKSAEYRSKRGKEELRKEFCDMLGYPLNDPESFKSGINAKTEPLGELNGMVMTRYQLEVLPNFWFYGMLYEHGESAGKNALIIAQHGGGGAPEYLDGVFTPTGNYNRMIPRVFRNGVTVFAPQLLLWGADFFGDAKKYDRHDADVKLKHLGGSIAALEVFCVMRSIEYFSARADIDESRVGMVGLSYGGQHTVYTAAADTRIKAALSSCWFNDRAEYPWPDWTHFNGANKFMDAEIASLILPRRLYIETAVRDELFPSADAEAEIARLKEYAAAENCADNLRYKAFDGLHELDPAPDGINFLLSALGV
ncbi:MAG: hypothetical protein LBP26_05965 [Clostridiales bacterium]|jgi:hypothetical protein|nr:hypothetical protein [Clostridiales bacterium]